MKAKLTPKESLLVATMLFGMFFGAGNLIFPAYLGRQAGSAVWPAISGLLVTGVGLPLLGVAAIGITRSDGLFALSQKVSRPYGLCFTCALYLTIGPFFAIPRCATVPFTLGMQPLVGAEGSGLALALFSLAFFAVVAALSLRPASILTSIGRTLTPLFLVFFGVLAVTVLLHPASPDAFEPLGSYRSNPFFAGFLEGYNTMDALAGLAFGIVVINVIRGAGVTRPESVAASTVRSGLFSCLIMAGIYIVVTLMGVQSRTIPAEAANGGEVLSLLANRHYGTAGALILAATVTLACLKTSVGLVTSCAETFVAIFPKGPGYRVWALLFSVLSFLIANVGLTAILDWSLPVLMLLYPLAITLILLGLAGKWFGHDPVVYRLVTGLTLVAALFDFFGALPAGAVAALHLEGAIGFAKAYLPLYGLGLGWVCPAALGLVLGLALRLTHAKKAAR